ncbi:hypothetical protein IPM19_02475 [bacterium]|nr:MAG: hypothetical protein IPM19_02475 [bacterium]
MQDQIPDNNEKKPAYSARTLAIAVEFGFIIAIPLAGTTLLGKWLSVKYDQPFYLYGAIIVAIILSSTILTVRIKKIYDEIIKK